MTAKLVFAAFLACGLVFADCSASTTCESCPGGHGLGASCTCTGTGCTCVTQQCQVRCCLRDGSGENCTTNCCPACSSPTVAAQVRQAPGNLIPVASGGGIEFQTAPEGQYGLKISDISAEFVGVRLGNLTYTLANGTDRAVSAVQVSFDAYAGDQFLGSFVNSRDWWLGSTGGLAPHTSRSGLDVNAAITSAGSRPTRLVATITFVEFEDGSRAGADYGSLIRDGRLESVKAYQEVRKTYERFGGGSELSGLLRKSCSAGGCEGASERGKLRVIYENGGAGALLMELARILDDPRAAAVSAR
jgi:hypothetical protein